MHTPTNKILLLEAYKRPVYATDGFEYVRTEPRDEEKNGVPFVGFIKTSKGEANPPTSSKTLHDTLFQGKEITREEYESAKL